MTPWYLQSWRVWVLLAGLAVGTFALRSSFVVFLDTFGEIPPRLEAVFPYVPPAVLAALVAPNVLALDASLALVVEPPRLAGGLAGFVVAWRTESMLATAVVGMVVFWVASGLLVPF